MAEWSVSKMTEAFRVSWNEDEHTEDVILLDLINFILIAAFILLLGTMEHKLENHSVSVLVSLS